MLLWLLTCTTYTISLLISCLISLLSTQRVLLLYACLDIGDLQVLKAVTMCFTWLFSYATFDVCFRGMSSNLTLEFRGGAELLFDGIKRHDVQLPRDILTVRHLLVWIRDNMLKERPEMFLQGSSVRPGILVLINNVDWELCGELDYKIANQDTVLFISTLHGG